MNEISLDSPQSHQQITVQQPPSGWIELDQTAFDHNIASYRRIIGPYRFLAVVLKSNAYGHGIDIVGNWCQENEQVNWMCTASLSEAIQLRKNGVKKPILVLYHLDENPLLAGLYKIDIMVSNIETLNRLHHVALSNQISFSVHIKIDTGMHRFGFNLEQFCTLLSTINHFSGINFTGIYTHFSDTDNSDQTFTLHQQQQFENILSLIANKPLFFYKHWANSATTSIGALGATNFIRLGLGSYGLWSSYTVQKQAQALHPWLDLKAVLQFKTRIIQIKHVPAGAPVGYAQTFVSPTDMKLALLPVGYYEGYQRRFSNITSVMITCRAAGMQTFIAPVIGRVSMNATCIDISHIPHAQVEDPVTLIGPYSPVCALELAHAINSGNPREILIGLNSQLKRISV